MIGCLVSVPLAQSQPDVPKGLGFRVQSLRFSRAAPRMPDADLGKCLLKGLDMMTGPFMLTAVIFVREGNLGFRAWGG